jgi:hypothetical protein
MSRGKGKPREDIGLSPANYPAVHEEFYAGDPADYFLRRLQGLLILKGEPEALRALMTDGIDAGRVRLQLVPGGGPGAISEEDDAEARDRFLTADSWLLLHHASETLLRLYVAHATNGPCPALEVARGRGPGDFKKKRASCLRVLPRISPKTGSSSTARLPLKASRRSTRMAAKRF